MYPAAAAARAVRRRGSNATPPLHARSRTLAHAGTVQAHFEQLSLKGRKGVQKQPVKGKKQPVKAKGFGYNAKLHHKAHLIKKPKVAFEKKVCSHAHARAHCNSSAAKRLV